MPTSIRLSSRIDMLGYRHGFHAGNFADVLKHLVLANTLEYLIRKPRPLLYIDTHAGAGVYPLVDEMAKKTGEAETGILRLNFARLSNELSSECKPSIAVFERLVSPYLANQHYPGSPCIAARMLRTQDRLALFELHPADSAQLLKEFESDRRVISRQSDGFLSAKSMLPAKQKKAIILIDPSYEIKSDYQKVVSYLTTAWGRAPDTHLLLWYPVIERSTTEHMIQLISKSGARDIWRFELCIAEDKVGYGMTGCGMLVVNPPWTLPQQLQELLPAICNQLATGSGHCKIECLVGE